MPERSSGPNASLLNRVAGKLTYANIVATLALFIALGGVSWAAYSLPKNSVGSKQIRKNAVSTTKVKNRSLLGGDLKNNTLKGTQVDEDSLGKVPAAASADVAGTSADRFTLVRREISSASNPNVGLARAYASEFPLVSHGPISLYGKCFEVGTTVYGEVYVRSAVDGAFGTYSNAYSDFLANPPLGTSFATEELRLVGQKWSLANNATVGGGGGVFLSPDGVGLSAGATIATIASAANPSLLFPSAKSCVFIVEGTRIG